MYLRKPSGESAQEILVGIFNETSNIQPKSKTKECEA